MKTRGFSTSGNSLTDKAAAEGCNEVSTQTMLNMDEIDRIMLLFLVPRVEACTQTDGTSVEELPVFDSSLVQNDDTNELDDDGEGMDLPHDDEETIDLIPETNNESQKDFQILNNSLSDKAKDVQVNSHSDSSTAKTEISVTNNGTLEKGLQVKEKVKEKVKKKAPKSTPAVLSRTSKRLALKKDLIELTSAKLKCQHKSSKMTKKKSSRKSTDKKVTRTPSKVKSESISHVKLEPSVQVDVSEQNVSPSKQNNVVETSCNENQGCNIDDGNECNIVSDGKSDEENTSSSVDSKRKNYFCDTCPSSFRDSHDLMRHKRIHTNEKPYQCPECNQSFRWKATYVTHRQRIHNKRKTKSSAKLSLSIKDKKVEMSKESCTDEPTEEKNDKPKERMYRGKYSYTCEYCGKVLRCLAHLKRHILVHSGKRPFKCSQCARAFSEQSGLKNHVLRRHSAKEFDCDLCGKHFGSRVFLKQHQKVHTKQREEFVCKLCEKVYTTNLSLEIHMRAHAGVRPFVCDICGRRLYSKYQLNRHVKHHYSNKVPAIRKSKKPRCHVCNVCSKGFGSSSHLLRHMSTVHSSVKDRHCPTCDMQFNSVGAMKKHMKEHNEGPYQCQVCERWWLTKETFKSHMQLHFGRTSSKIFVCVHCNIGFFLMLELEDHYKSHNENKPFNCVHCEKKFELEADLVSHRKVHPNQSVPLNCDRCDKLFVTLQELSAHEHSHDHPFECVICDLKFSDEEATKEHMQSHDDDGSILSSTMLAYKCPKCGKVFFSKEDYGHHAKIHDGAEFICNLCDFAFDNETSLQDHCRTHNLIKVEAFKDDEESESQMFEQQVQIYEEPEVKSAVISDTSTPVETLETVINYEAVNDDELSVCQTLHIGDGNESISCTVCGKKFFLIENFLNHCQDHPEIEVTVKTI